MPAALDTLHTLAALDYLELVRFMPLRPIRNRAAHTKAVKILTQLAKLGNMNKDQSDYFDVLSELVEDYERPRCSLGTTRLSVTDILNSLLDDHDMTDSDLGRLLGERTLGHKVLSGKRKLTTAQVRILADHFRVSTDLFIS